AATWMDLEITMFSERSQKEKDKYWTSLRWNLKNNSSEFIYETETDEQTLETNLWLPKRKGGGLGIH
ncbi:hypothetical protein OFN31_34435, partial [Escherichia coli]|nr:hypothetical protein [Escherichia coli]